MEEQQPAIQAQPMTPPPAPKSSRNKWLMLIFCLTLIIVAVGGGLIVSQLAQKAAPPADQTSIPTSITPAPPAEKQTTWKLYNPSNYTFTAPDNSFSFAYPTGWVYETIDGIIPQQQHIVQFGRERTQAERQELAQKAGIELNDTLGSISYVNETMTLYYTNTPDFQVKKIEDLATGTILSKKQITIDKTVPALEIKANCPTDCAEIVFTKGQQNFIFILAKTKADTKPLDTTALTQIESTFTFSK